MTDEKTALSAESKAMVDWYLNYQLQHRSTGSATSMAAAMTAIIGTGVCYPVVIGGLDLENIERFLRILADPDAMRAIAKAVHWGDAPY